MAHITDPEFIDATARLEKLYQTEMKPQPTKRETHVDQLGYGRWVGGDYTTNRVNKGMAHEPAVQAMLNAVRVVAGIPVVEPPPVEPPPSGGWGTTKPITGWLRKGDNATFADDSGPRRIQACSYFPALRVAHDDWDNFRRNLDSMVGRWQMYRLFWHLAHPGFWTGNEVDPYASWFESTFNKVVKESSDRGLRLMLTAGDLQYLSGSQADAFRHVAQMAAATGNQQAFALTEMINEARVNSDEGEDWDHWAARSKDWQAIYPWGLHMLSDPGCQEEPAGLRASCQSPANIISLHGTREGWEDAIRRAFNVRYEGVTDIPIAQTEPTGPDTEGYPPKVYQPVNDPAALLAIYTMHVITGQLPTYFSGASLVNRQPLENDWGFKELPKLWDEMDIPQNIGQWDILPGHQGGAPLNTKSFADTGEGPARTDQAVSPDGSRAIAIPYAGKGRWRFSTDWDAEYQVWGHEGVRASGTVYAGEELPMSLDADDRAVVITLSRR